ncbi:MAG TPA: hypothetical protein VGE08_13440 [Steroidobacter sp.]|uniref:hypothetical protein n=1 Tax=Steroidobacter sp. TaxID=1978227 RepID=UPI002EDB125F
MQTIAVTGANGFVGRVLVGSGLPLPFGSVENSRSLISVWNLADVIFAAITRPGPTTQTLLTADDVAPSTTELIRAIADAMQANPARTGYASPAFVRHRCMHLECVRIRRNGARVRPDVWSIMDGIDGLAASDAIFVAVAGALLQAVVAGGGPVIPADRGAVHA